MVDVKHVIRTRAIIRKKDKILTLTETNDTLGLPGGRLNPGETIEQALIREVKEETGLFVTKFKLCYLGDVPEHNSVVIFYAVEVEEGDVSTSEEHKDFKWMTLEEINNDKTTGPNFRKACEVSLKILF